MLKAVEIKWDVTDDDIDEMDDAKFWKHFQQR